MRMMGIMCAMVMVYAGGVLAAGAGSSQYRGWKSLALSNGLVTVQVVPEVGGRVMQLSLAGFDFLWVNSALAGKAPTANGLAPDGGWLSYGGDKLWPAPQGWENEQQWPGPPDAVLDGSAHVGAVVSAVASGATVRVTSQKDKRSGIQFSRTITVHDLAAKVSFDSTMTCTDTKPRSWGIWQVTQLDAANRQGSGYNKEIICYSPVNPSSVHPNGYSVMFGDTNNPSFSLDSRNKMAVAHYQYKVGKIGADNTAGWIATVDGTAGSVFVQRFKTFPGAQYPDKASVEFWMNGVGVFFCFTNKVVAKDDPIETPYLVESEVLSPMATLKPGESYSFQNEWAVARIGGNYPILDCTEAGVTCEPLTARQDIENAMEIKGRFGVFYQGTASVQDEKGSTIMKLPVTPTQPLVIDVRTSVATNVSSVSVVISDATGVNRGELAHVKVGEACHLADK